MGSLKLGATVPLDQRRARAGHNRNGCGKASEQGAGPPGLRAVGGLSTAKCAEGCCTHAGVNTVELQHHAASSDREACRSPTPDSRAPPCSPICLCADEACVTYRYASV